MTASAIASYAQQEDYETGRIIGRTDREWAIYNPPRNGNAAMLAGYESAWSQQNLIETESHADTDEEARFELDLDYAESMWS